MLLNVWNDWQVTNAQLGVPEDEFESRILIDPLIDSRVDGTDTWYEIQDAQLEAVAENPDKFIMLAPRDPMLSDALGIHSTTEDRRQTERDCR